MDADIEGQHIRIPKVGGSVRVYTKLVGVEVVGRWEVEVEEARKSTSTMRYQRLLPPPPPTRDYFLIPH